MEDLVKKYLQEKYGENYDQKAQGDYDSAKDTNRWANLGSNIGDVIAGNKVGSANDYFQNLNKQAKENTIGKIDKDRDQFIDNNIKSGQMADIQRKNDQSDPNSQPSQAFRKIMESKYGDVVKSYGDSWKNVTAADQDNIFKPLQLKEQMDARREQARILAGQRSDARQDKQDEKNTKRQEKIDEREQTLAVPGYTRSGEVLQKPEEAMKFRKATAVADQMSKKLNRMKELVNEYGSYENGGSGGQEMESLATEIQLLGKSPELYELGVLAGPDLTLLEKITSDPTSLKSMFTRDSTRKTQIETQLKSMQQKLESTSKSLGYNKKQEFDVPETKVVNGIQYSKVPGGWKATTETAKR